MVVLVAEQECLHSTPLIPVVAGNRAVRKDSWMRLVGRPGNRAVEARCCAVRLPSLRRRTLGFSRKAAAPREGRAYHCY